MDCNGKVTYTVTAWDTNDASARTFTGVKVYSGSTLVGTGNFNSADNFSFTGSFTVDSGVNSVVVTAKTDGTWGDGYTGVDETSDHRDPTHQLREEPDHLDGHLSVLVDRGRRHGA